MKRLSQSENKAQLWMWLVKEVNPDAVKSNIARYLDVRSMNQGKLEVVKEEMARVNIDILGINELKWTEISECNSDDHDIYYHGQDSHRRNGVALIVNRRVRNAVLGYNIKNSRIISTNFWGKPLNIIVIQVYVPTTNAEEVEQFYEDLQDLLKLTPKKVPFP